MLDWRPLVGSWAMVGKQYLLLRTADWTCVYTLQANIRALFPR